MLTVDYRLGSMIDAYLECAFWLLPEEPGYAEAQASTELLQRAQDDCRAFLESLPEGAEYLDGGFLGHNFFLTRERHGSGFWDRGLGPLGDALTALAQSFGQADIYVGDDGRLY